jgi:hypothetical protein
MQSSSPKPKARYRVPRMETRFPTAAFFALLLIGFGCLYAASQMRPNYGVMQTYRNDPAYVATSRVFLKLQTLSNAIAAGNPRTVSQLQALAHVFRASPHKLQRRKPKP